MTINDFCRSCGLPLVEGKLARGTNADGSVSSVYCEFCFKDGVLLTKDMLPQQIVDCSTSVYIERFGWKNPKNARKEAELNLKSITG